MAHTEFGTAVAEKGETPQPAKTVEEYAAEYSTKMNALMVLIKHHRDNPAGLPLRNRYKTPHGHPLDRDNGLYEQPIGLDHLAKNRPTLTTIDDPVQEDPDTMLAFTDNNLAAGELPRPGKMPTSEERRRWLDQLQADGAEANRKAGRPDKMVVYMQFPSHFEYVERVSGASYAGGTR